MRVGRQVSRTVLAVLIGLGLAYVGDLAGIIRTEFAQKIWAQIKGWPAVAHLTADPIGGAILISLAGLALLFMHERLSGFADIRYSRHGSKQFFLNGKPVHFLFQAWFVNLSQQDTSNVAALADFWAMRSTVRSVFCRWAVGRPPSDSPTDTGFQTDADTTVISPGRIPVRLNLAIRQEGQAAPKVYGRVLSLTQTLDEGSTLIRLRLSGAHVRETVWLLMRNVSEPERERALSELSAPRAWAIWARMALGRRKALLHHPSSMALEASSNAPEQHVLAAAPIEKEDPLEKAHQKFVERIREKRLLEALSAKDEPKASLLFEFQNKYQAPWLQVDLGDDGRTQHLWRFGIRAKRGQRLLQVSAQLEGDGFLPGGLQVCNADQGRDVVDVPSDTAAYFDFFVELVPKDLGAGTLFPQYAALVRQGASRAIHQDLPLDGTLVLTAKNADTVRVRFTIARDAAGRAVPSFVASSTSLAPTTP